MPTHRYDPVAEPRPRLSRELSALVVEDVEPMVRKSERDLHVRRVQAAHRYLADELGVDDTDVATAIVRLVLGVR